MASILDEIRSEVESELSAQPEEKPKSILDEVKQEVSAELAPQEPKTDFFKTAQQSLEEKPPTTISGGDVFLNAISHKRSNELDDEDKGLFNALSDDEQYKVAQARKDIPLDDAQARKIFEIEKSKMPSIPTSWEDWYNLGGDAVDVVKNVAKIPIKVGLGAGELARDVINATDMTVSDEQALKNLQKAKGSVYSFMAPVFELPESVTWAATKAKEGGFSWADALGEKSGLVDPEDRFERWKGRRLVDQAHAEYFREHPTVYGRMLDNPLTKDALAFIAKSEMESPKELSARTGISVEEAKKQQDDLVKKGIEDLTSQMESELPEEQAGPRIAGEFLLPGELGMGTMGAVSLVAKVTPEIAKGLKYIGKTDDEIAEINKAAQVLEKQKFEKILEQRTARAESVARGAEKLEEAVQKFKPIAEKATGTLSKIAAPVIGGVAGYEAAPESPLAGLLTGALGGAAARSVLKGTKLGLEIPTLVKEVAEARKVAPLGKTFETLGRSAEGSALKAKLLSHGGKTIDNILSNASEYAKAGIHGTTLALTTGALESADPEEMKQILSDGLAISLGGRALQHIKGKFMGIDPVIAQRERISDDSRIHRRFQESDADTQANLNQISDFNNAILFRDKKLSESQAVLASAITSNDSARIKEAQSLVDANTKALSLTKRANVQTRNEFGRQFLKTYADLQDITNGVLRTGQNNVGFNILSTDQIYQKLRNDPANKDVPDADLAQMASQAGFYSNPAQEGVVFDRRKPSIVLNADSIRERIRTFGESPQEALVHESSHFMDAVPEFQDALGDVRSMLFQNEIRDAAGNIKATTPGVFSKAKLVELFNDGYLRHLDPQGKESFAKLNKLWDESRGQLDENRVSEYMKREVMADLLGEVTSRHLGKDLSSATLAMFDRAKIKARKNLLDRAINRFYGFGGRGDIVAAANTRAEFPPEAMAAARDAMRQIVALNGEISPPVAEAQMPKISRAQMMKNSALLDRFGKDSPLFKTEFKVKVFDKDGNQIGDSMPVTTPNPREGTFQSSEGGFKKLSGYGDIPVEAQGLQVPEGGTLVVSRDLVMQPDGVTPVMYDAKDAKKIASERRKLIVEALDTDDYGTPNRFEQVSEGSETYRGTFTPAQIKAIQDMPESLIPKTLKQHMLKVNDAIARGDGTRFITDYAAVMNDNGTYQAFSPKIYDLVPIGMHLSKAGNFLVTTISVGRIFDKMRLWNERMPGRLRFWDNNLERTFDDFTKYLNNWQQGKPGETGLDANPQIALQKKNIFNDLLNLYDKATEYTNLDRTVIPRKKGDPRGKDPNRTIMSIRVDHIAEMLENPNATKLPVSYGFAKQNFMPERMEGEVVVETKYPIEEKGKWYSNEDYAKRGGKIVKMSPDEFLSQVRPLEIDEASRDNIDDLKNMMQEGRKLDPLAIYQDGKEDGRHRAIAAKELGITEIPVIDFRQEKPTEQERIVAATYTDPRTGEVREGVNHKAANPNAPDEQTDRESRYYGFKTDTGRVVDREEAYRIAEESGQLKEATSEEDRFNADRGVLHSNMVEMGDKLKTIYHGTTEDAVNAIEKGGFDVSKSADGTIWFTSNKDKIIGGEVAASGKGGIIERQIDESKLKLGSWEESDKYSTDELIQKGYDGLKLDDGDEITYQIFYPEKLSKIIEPTISEKPQSSEMIGGMQFMPERPIGRTEQLPDFEKTIIKGVTPINKFNWEKATNVEFDIGNGRKMSFSYDPKYLEKPVFKDLIKELKGQPVILLEADRQRATGGDMGGPLHPFLKSNQVTITGPDGKEYKAVWANMTSTFVSGAKNRLASHGAKYALVHLMDSLAHKSNKRTARTLDKMMRDSNLNQREKEIISLSMQAGIIAGEKSAMNAAVTALKRQINAAKGDKNKIKLINDKISKINKERENITPKGIYGEIFDAISKIKTAHSNVKTGNWGQDSIEKANKKLEQYIKSKQYKELLSKNKSLYISDNIGNTFSDRGSAIGSILSFKFNKFDPSLVMRESSDFKEGENLDIITAVELSQNPEIFALYFGNDPKEEAAMSPAERKARDEMRANPDFVEHESYDWVMLGPKNGNNFLVQNPVKPEEVFKKYRETHAGKTVVDGSAETVAGAMRKNAGFILRVGENTEKLSLPKNKNK
jgi:hypothetical protein